METLQIIAGVLVVHMVLSLFEEYIAGLIYKRQMIEKAIKEQKKRAKDLL